MRGSSSAPRPSPPSTPTTATETPMPIPVARLNHAVLFVRDAERAAEFYTRLFGFDVVGKEMGGQAIVRRPRARGGTGPDGLSVRLTDTTAGLARRHEPDHPAAVYLA